MAIQAHLVELERKHKILENELHEALVHLSTDDLQIVELKRRKLMVKDEIERLKHTAAKRSTRTSDSTNVANEALPVAIPDERFPERSSAWASPGGGA
jgi:hypothetical protein